LEVDVAVSVAVDVEVESLVVLDEDRVLVELVGLGEVVKLEEPITGVDCSGMVPVGMRG
jgi:hypothetical protein